MQGAEARESSSQTLCTPVAAWPSLRGPGSGSHGVCDRYEGCQHSQQQGELMGQALVLASIHSLDL